IRQARLPRRAGVSVVGALRLSVIALLMFLRRFVVYKVVPGRRGAVSDPRRAPIRDAPAHRQQWPPDHDAFMSMNAGARVPRNRLFAGERGQEGGGAAVVAVLAQVDALPGPEREAAPATGSDKDGPRTDALMCAGMSSGPSIVCVQYGASSGTTASK